MFGKSRILRMVFDLSSRVKIKLLWGIFLFISSLNILKRITKQNVILYLRGFEIRVIFLW